MGSSLQERAARYRRLSETLTNSSDIDAVRSFADELDDISALEFPILPIGDAAGYDPHWLKAALSRVFRLQPASPPLLEVLFSEVINGGGETAFQTSPDFQYKRKPIRDGSNAGL